MKTLTPALTLAAAALLVTAQDARAQAKPEARGPKIAVIDMARIYSDSLLGKSYTARIESLRNEIEAERTKKQSDLTKMDAAVKALQDEIEKQQSVLSPEALEKKRQELVKKSRDRQAYLEDGQQDLQRMQERAQQQAQTLQNEFQVKIKPHVDAVAKEKGLDILLDSGGAMTMNKDFDISQDVIVRADDAERAGRKPGAAKPPAAAPAPTPTPTPTPNPQKP